MVPTIGLAPLFVGVPGGPELLVILLMAVVMFGLPVVLLGGGLYLYRRTQSDRPANEEIAALRREVERLRDDIDQLDDDQREDRSSDDSMSSDSRADSRLQDYQSSSDRPNRKE
jgi:sec-independent protein translocase protein TatA